MSDNPQQQDAVEANIQISILETTEETAKYRSQIARLTYQSSPEYFNFLFGSQSTACSQLELWTERSDSEYSGSCCTVLFKGGEASGSVIAFGGSELPRRRRADLFWLMKQWPGNQRGELARKLAALADSTAPVDGEDYYVRVLAIAPEFRGCGLGAQLLTECVKRGGSQGFTRVRLDVRAENLPAVRLYERSGFKVIREVEMATGWRLLSMSRTV